MASTHTYSYPSSKLTFSGYLSPEQIYWKSYSKDEKLCAGQIFGGGGGGGKEVSDWLLADLYCITQKYFLKLISFFLNAP